MVRKPYFVFPHRLSSSSFFFVMRPVARARPRAQRTQSAYKPNATLRPRPGAGRGYLPPDPPGSIMRIAGCASRRLAAVFFTLGLYLIHRNKMLPFYALYAIASLNRETFAFLTVVYVLVNWHRPKRQLVVSCAVQFLIAISIRLLLVSIYGFRPLQHIAVFENLGALPDPYTIGQLLSALGFLWIFPLLGWRLIPDPFLKRACLILPVIGAPALCMTNIDEIRAYGEYVGIVLPPALLVMQRIFADAGDQTQPSTVR